jgi:hypothetical protein
MTTETKAPFFSFPHPMNGNVARAVALGVVVMAALVIASTVVDIDFRWLLFPLAYGFIARVAAGPRLSPLALLVTKIIVPKFKLPYEPVPGPPKRFAATMGIGFSVTALILEFGFGYTVAANIALGMLIFAAGLEAFLGFCLGCQIFAILMRVGVISEEICEDCSDWGRRAIRLKKEAAEREAAEALAAQAVS